MNGLSGIFQACFQLLKCNLSLAYLTARQSSKRHFFVEKLMPRAVREGNNCLPTAKIMLFSETRNFFTSFFAF